MFRQRTLDKVLNDYLYDVLKCVRCGFCNSVCPTSNISLSYRDSRTSRGRIVLLQAKHSSVLNLSIESNAIQELMDLCFGCRRCLEVCPAGVRIPQLIWRVKSSGPLRLNKFFYTYYGTFEKLGAMIPTLSNLLVKSNFGRTLLEQILDIDRNAPFPSFYGDSLEKYIKKHSSSNGDRGRLALFIDVFTNYHDVELGIRTVNLLQRLGYRVEAPPQMEAGTLALEFGALKRAVKIARFNIDSMYEFIKNDGKVITISPAAYVALKIDYPELLGDEKSRIVAENTIDIVDILLNEYDDGRIRFKGPVENAVYHHSCFTKAARLTTSVKRLLELAGYKLTEFEECCGIAGIWGLIKKHHEASREIGNKLFTKIEHAQMPVFSQSETCRLQLKHYTNSRIMHPLEGVMDRILL